MIAYETHLSIRQSGHRYRHYFTQHMLERRPKALTGRSTADGTVVLHLQQPEIVVGTWRAARAEQDDISEDEARQALTELDPL